MTATLAMTAPEEIREQAAGQAETLRLLLARLISLLMAERKAQAETEAAADFQEATAEAAGQAKDFQAVEAEAARARQVATVENLAAWTQAPAGALL